MANLTDIISDFYPPVSGVSLPLNSTIWVQFNTLMDEEELQNTLFVEGPDTDQYIGPGLIELKSPGNISQGNLNDFLQSPGLKGMVSGNFTFDTVAGVGTKVTFTPCHALAPSTDYVVHLMESLDANGHTVSGNYIWPFETGTGSIQQLPSNLSTSVLADAIAHGYVAAPGGTPKLSVVRTHPDDHSVENNLQLEAIVVEFDKLLDPASVTPESVFVETLPVTDHPSAPQFAQGEIMTQLEVSGYQLKIRLL